jgi:predicted dehydrogenase
MIKLIIIGSGQVVSTTHLPNLMLLKDEVEVVGIVDTQLEKAKALASQYKIPKVSSDYKELISQIQPDAALVTVPNRFHCQTSIDLLEQGIHVFCEKSPATNGNDALKMEQASLENDKLLTYGFHFRYSNDAAYIQQLIQSGEFGKVYHLNIKWLRRRGIPGWGSFTKREIQGGGPLIDLGIHFLDLGMFFLGNAKPQVVLSSASDLIGRKGGHGFMGEWDGKEFSVEDGLFAFIRFENDISIALSTSYAINMEAENDKQVSIYGERMGAELFPLKLFGESHSRQFITSFMSEESQELHLKCVRNFIRAVGGREPLLVTAHQGTQVQTLVDAIYESAETGKAITLV